MSKDLDDLMAGAAETASVSAAVQRSLAALGEDPSRIAQTLERGEAYGLRNQPAYCPVAVWVDAGLDGVLGERERRVRVDASCIVVDTDEGAHLELSPSPGVAGFVRRFDAGQYPQLEREESQQMRVGGVGDFYVTRHDYTPEQDEEGELDG